MTWFAFPGGWGVYNLNGADEKELALTGAHGYATEAQAEAHVNASPSPDQEALLQTFKAVSTLPVGGGITGDLSTPSSSGGLAHWALQFGNTTGLLTRILKVTFGGVLLIAGILKLSGKQDVIVSTGKKVIEGAALA